MPNIFWYGLLTAISIITFIFTLKKAKDRKVIALYTFLSGLTYLFEYVILVIFKSYVYHPNVLKNDYFDSILGAVVSDAFSVPMAGTLVGARKLSWKWMLFIVGILLIIEKCFLFINIYSHFWWNISYTAVGLIFCFSIAKIWYRKLLINLTIPVHFISMYFTCMLIQTSIAFILVAFFDLYHYKIGWFADGTRDHVAFTTAYIMFLSLILTSLVTIKIKWAWKIITILLTFPIDWLLWKNDILHISDKWSLWSFLTLRFGVIIFLVIFNDYIFNSSGKKKYRK
jgi:hypothetical protein